MISLVNFYFVLTINNFFKQIFDEEINLDWLVSWLSILCVVLRIVYYATKNNILTKHINKYLFIIR